jgi:aspartyl-tRNA(Asn)/glutamyl-tRNA(Gln) amidotransferase subunit B
MGKTYTPTIGLEVHAELKTKTKMFCDSKNDADEARPNVNICPVCMAHPGALPVINAEAVRHVLKVGVALGAKLADYTEFDRKNYFYPDQPKGYQLSQYEFPLVSGGSLNGIAITRVHLEEDTASSIHNESDGTTMIDYNRSGVPLMELVTEPVIHSAEEAGNFGRELQLLLRYLQVSDADMEKGHMRLEANISVSDTDTFGTKVEVKNINSFRAMERAVEYEIKRQIKLLEEGGQVKQETRGWDDAKQATFSQRTKEGSADYRYFPDPDLPSLMLSELGYTVERFKKMLPELPNERRQRLAVLGINPQDIELYVREDVFGDFFAKVSEELGANAEILKLASNYIANDLVNIVREDRSRDTEIHSEISISPIHFVKIITMLSEGKISSRSGKELLLTCSDGVSDPEKVATEKKLFQERDTAKLEAEVSKVLLANPTVVADYKGGKASSLEFLLGQCMKALRGAADPQLLREELKKQLGA